MSVKSLPVSKGAPSSVLVIGGAGFVGDSIIIRLLGLGHAVSCLDMTEPSKAAKDLCECIFVGEITDAAFLLDAFRRAEPDVVIHLASFGMSGADMLDPKCFDVNVDGTNNIIRACLATNAKMLVYTSTYNVIFGGQEIYNGEDDRMKYFPRAMAIDQYGPSKALAEQAVISADGSTGGDGVSVLRTCALRPAAIYGEHERRHFTRIVKHIDSGVFLFRIGSALVDWVYIDNLVDAYVLVINKYQENSGLNKNIRGVPPFGQCYAISDGTPVDNFEFLKPLCEARLCAFPTVTVPTPLMVCLAFVLEQIHFFLHCFGLSDSPFLTRSEVHKVGVTHFFSIEKARAELGYAPKITTTEGSLLLAKHYREAINNENFFRIAHPIWWLLCDGGMALTYYFAYSRAVAPILLPLFHFSLKIFGTQKILSYVFILASLAHLGEGLYAYALAAQKGCSPSRQIMWFVQTVFLGYPSLSMILDRPEFSKLK